MRFSARNVRENLLFRGGLARDKGTRTMRLFAEKAMPRFA